MAGHSETRLRLRPGTVGHHRLVLAWWLAALLGAAVPAWGALQFDVFLGYDGIVPPQRWCSVVFEIKNDGPGFVGTVEVTEGWRNPQTRRTVVELPTGTLKRLVMPVFSPGGLSGLWDARLLDERGKVRAEQTGLRSRRNIRTQTPLLGALVRTPSGMPAPQPIRPADKAQQPATARLLPDIFPDNPLALEGLDCLYLSSEKALVLKTGQVEALLAWLHGGGHLIVGVEQVNDVTATPWLREVVPCDLSDMRTVQGHSELQEWLRDWVLPVNAARAEETEKTSRQDAGAPPAESASGAPGGQRRSPAQTAAATTNVIEDLPVDPAFELAALPVATGRVRDGRVVVAAEGGDKPLIVTANRGYGRVTLLLFSPEREPFRSWQNLPTFWARLIDKPGALRVSEDSRQTVGLSSDGIFGAMIGTRQVHKLAVTWLLGLLLVYLLVIGPLDRYWLRRIGRPMLTWITFPCYVVMFSMLIYVIGYKLRAGDSEWNELHVVDVLGKGEQARLRGRTYASVYSPSNQKYRLKGRQEFAALRGELVGSGQPGEKATFTQAGDGSFEAEIFVPVWTSQLYVSDWWEPAPLPLAVTVVRLGDRWEVKVENRTERDLTSAQLVIEDYLIPLGGVPVRETKVFRVAKGQGKPLEEFVSEHARRFRAAVLARQGTFRAHSSEHIDDLCNGSIVASFLSRATYPQDHLGYYAFSDAPGLDLSLVASRGNAVLLAWAPDYAPVQPMRQFTPRLNQRNTLWRVPVTVK